MKLAITAIFSIFFITAIYSQPIGWVEQTSGVTTQLTSVSIVDDNNAWICGYAGVVLRTTNGGTNWVSVSSAPIPPTLDLHSIYAIDATTALAAGSGTSSFLYRTSNGGANWTQVFTETGGFINSVQMGNSFAGFMMGDPVGGRWSLWGTTTGGLTWDSASFYLPQTGSDAGWNNSFFFDASAGVWFGTNNTRVYKSLTLVNWTTQPTTGQVNSYAIWFNSPFTGLTGGTALLITTNGGLNWVNPPAALPGTANLSGITGFGTQWVVTRQATAIYLSPDNGVTWQTSYTAPAGNYRHIAKNRANNLVYYGVRSNGGISKGMLLVGIEPVSNIVPDKFELKQNYPNPFNPNTTIEFSIPKNSFVKLAVYDALGREVNSLLNNELKAGEYSINFSAADLASGTYYYKLISGEQVETKKMILVK
ncbi:MAG TPA: YCF48-related protein [Ignavibacteria bacterium]|nr:YCF48-related protein [Ignavibacteria bacterium]HMQ99067.1 YCF48-related protein [Ignavibacteria bacterium]